MLMQSVATTSSVNHDVKDNTNPLVSCFCFFVELRGCEHQSKHPMLLATHLRLIAHAKKHKSYQNQNAIDLMNDFDWDDKDKVRDAVQASFESQRVIAAMKDQLAEKDRLFNRQKSMLAAS
jgi:hypothetical protein